jgi:hypothetical protein
VVTGATGATAKFMNFRIEGTVDVANAGGIVPQGKWSAAPGNVTSVKRGTFWRMTPIGPSGLVSVGDFA